MLRLQLSLVLKVHFISVFEIVIHISMVLIIRNCILRFLKCKFMHSYVYKADYL